jgi:4'-phosphopantetheinyl transferase
MELNDNTIHLWMTDLALIADEALPARYLTLLTPDEKQRHAQFRFDADRLRYLATRALVRTVLSRYIPIAPEAWRFTEDTYGRPSILNAPGRAAQLNFSLSHSGSLILLAVTSGTALGVDVEHRRGRPAPLEVADRYFARAEVNQLRAIPFASQSDRFFDFWTLKESYMKAKGMGLSLPLDRLSFAFPTDTGITFSIDQDLAGEAARWRFWQSYPSDDYVMAICAERGSKQSPQVLAKRIIPMSEEAAFEPASWRRSSA